MRFRDLLNRLVEFPNDRCEGTAVVFADFGGNHFGGFCVNQRFVSQSKPRTLSRTVVTIAGRRYDWKQVLPPIAACMDMSAGAPQGLAKCGCHDRAKGLVIAVDTRTAQVLGYSDCSQRTSIQQRCCARTAATTPQDSLCQAAPHTIERSCYPRSNANATICSWFRV